MAVGQHGSKPVLEASLWHACAGGLVSLAPAGSLVVFFPQGYGEQAVPPPVFPEGLETAVVCRVKSVDYLADPESDEVFARVRLQAEASDPEGAQNGGKPAAEEDSQSGVTAVERMGSNGGCDGALKTGAAAGEGSGAAGDWNSATSGDGASPPELRPAAEKGRQQTFAKMLTQSDANNGGGFSVPRYCAESIFPALDYSLTPPSQLLHARDVHGQVWKFRHIYRGTPRRHLLTTGWSTFVNAKKLVAGNAIMFIRSADGELFVGVRRAIRDPRGGDKAGWRGSFSPRVPRYNITDTAGYGIRLANRGRPRIIPETVLHAAHLACKGHEFEVMYYPRSSTAPYIVPKDVVAKALTHGWKTGLRFKMAFETEDSSRTSWFTGTVLMVGDMDPMLWPRSLWRCLQVTWDDPELLQGVTRVSPWQVEPLGGTPLALPLIQSAPVSAKRRRGMPGIPTLPITSLPPTLPAHGGPPPVGLDLGMLFGVGGALAAPPPSSLYSPASSSFETHSPASLLYSSGLLPNGSSLGGFLPNGSSSGGVLATSPGVGLRGPSVLDILSRSPAALEAILAGSALGGQSGALLGSATPSHSGSGSALGSSTSSGTSLMHSLASLGERDEEGVAQALGGLGSAPQGLGAGLGLAVQGLGFATPAWGGDHGKALLQQLEVLQQQVQQQLLQQLQQQQSQQLLVLLQQHYQQQGQGQGHGLGLRLGLGPKSAAVESAGGVAQNSQQLPMDEGTEQQQLEDQQQHNHQQQHHLSQSQGQLPLHLMQPKTEAEELLYMQKQEGVGGEEKRQEVRQGVGLGLGLGEAGGVEVHRSQGKLLPLPHWSPPSVQQQQLLQQTAPQEKASQAPAPPSLASRVMGVLNSLPCPSSVPPAPQWTGAASAALLPPTASLSLPTPTWSFPSSTLPYQVPMSSLATPSLPLPGPFSTSALLQSLLPATLAPHSSPLLTPPLSLPTPASSLPLPASLISTSWLQPASTPLLAQPTDRQTEPLEAGRQTGLLEALSLGRVQGMSPMGGVASVSGAHSVSDILNESPGQRVGAEEPGWSLKAQFKDGVYGGAQNATPGMPAMADGLPHCSLANATDTQMLLSHPELPSGNHRPAFDLQPHPAATQQPPKPQQELPQLQQAASLSTMAVSPSPRPVSPAASSDGGSFCKVFSQHKPVGRTIDLRRYSGHGELQAALAEMFDMGPLDRLIYLDHDQQWALAREEPYEDLCAKATRAVIVSDVEALPSDKDLPLILAQ